MEKTVIEPARIAASGKLKTNVKIVKNNIDAWNEQHQLGLTDLREKASAATWHLVNCVVAVRKLEDDTTEILLVVARRQSAYRWDLGFYPEDSARASWNRILQLLPREMWATPMLLLDSACSRFFRGIAELAESDPRMSELARLVRISECAQVQYGVDASGRATAGAIAFVHKQIAQAKEFKREQDALADLTPEELANRFWQVQRANKPPGKTIRRRSTVTLNPPPTAPPLKEGELPDVETMKQYYPSYNPETAKEILNVLSEARKEWERVGGRWGPGVIAQKMMIKKGTVSHYLSAFRMAGLRKWGSIKLP